MAGNILDAIFASKFIVPATGLITVLGFLRGLVLVLIVAWILAIPFRLAIEIAGRLLGEDPKIGNLMSAFLIIVMNFNAAIGLLLFILKFWGQMPLWKVILLAFLSLLVLSGIAYAIGFILSNIDMGQLIHSLAR